MKNVELVVVSEPIEEVKVEVGAQASFFNSPWLYIHLEPCFIAGCV